MGPEVLIISDRRTFKERLAPLLSRCCDVRYLGSRYLPWSLGSPSRVTRLAVLDIRDLFRPVPILAAPSSPEVLPITLVMGFRADKDAVIAALQEGIPFYIFEDQSKVMFEEYLRLENDIYSQMGHLCAQRVLKLLVKRHLRHGLTSREAEIHGLIADGYSNFQIADLLGIEVKTVKNHITHLFGKIGVASRYEAISRSSAYTKFGPSRFQ